MRRNSMVKQRVFSSNEEAALTKAWAIANALIESGRASSPVPVRGYLCLKAQKAGYYWVANDADRVLFGLNIDSAVNITL